MGSILGNYLFFSQWGNAVFAGPFSYGEWHSAAVTNSGNYVSLYLDGELVASGTMYIGTAANTDFFIGRLPGYLGDYRNLNGLVDEVRVFNTALSPAEILSLSQRAPSTVTPEPSATFAWLTCAFLLVSAFSRRTSLVARVTFQ
jgi:hypothetical protein